MKIYTKMGDQGETGLFGGERVSKSHARIEAYGEIDELNAVIGVVRSHKPGAPVDGDLEKIQNDLFSIGAVLATPDSKKLEGKGGFVNASDAEFLEKAIDRMEAELAPLKTFILPGGDVVAAQAHLARTVCRRAERRIVGLSESVAVDHALLVYVNRLSDYLFVLARWINLKKGVIDVAWRKK